MKHTIYIMCRAARAAAPMASVRAALLLVVTLLLAAACTNEQETPAPIAPDGFPADGRLGIGQLLISGNNPDDYRSRKPLEGADTRIYKGATGWEKFDYIRVTATDRTGGTLVAYYEYRANGTWEQQNVSGSLPPEVLPKSTYPLYIDDIDRSQPIRVESWGGVYYDTEKENPTNYTDQGSVPKGFAYYWNDHILCPTATLHTANDAANGITRGSLTGTLAHQRVAVDVRVFTDDAHPLNTTDINATQLRLILPDSYSTGSTSTGSAGSTGSAATLRTWMSASTPAEGGQKGYTTFRAYVKLADLPGASAPQQDEQGQYVTITPESPMGTLQYATTVDGVTLPGSGKLTLRYSVKTAGTSAQPTPVRPGTRLTVDVDFTSLKNPVLTATLSPWQEVEGGDLPTYADVAKGNGTQPLDPAIFNTTRTNWIVSGGGTPEADALVAKNVRDALNRIYKAFVEDGSWNGDPYTGSTFIDLTLTGVKTLPLWNTEKHEEIGAFQNYKQLRSISLPAATTIGKQAFSACEALTTISLPVATNIEYNAFGDCTALKSISLPAATTIGVDVFKKCPALITLSLPAATSIGDRAFDNCTALATLRLTAAGNFTLHADVFAGFTAPSACTLVLNPDKQPDVVGNEWAGQTWKTITYAQP